MVGNVFHSPPRERSYGHKLKNWWQDPLKKNPYSEPYSMWLFLFLTFFSLFIRPSILDLKNYNLWSLQLVHLTSSIGNKPSYVHGNPCKIVFIYHSLCNKIWKKFKEQDSKIMIRNLIMQNLIQKILKNNFTKKKNFGIFVFHFHGFQNTRKENSPSSKF